MNPRFHMVYGTGPDSVGLVERIAAPIAAAGGNVVNLRQDVLHGLFTVFVVVDLAPARLSPEQFAEVVRQIASDTGLRLVVEQYAPAPRAPARRDLLLTLVGRDRPGIVAALAESLREHGVNIESSQAIAREGVFLMELLVDIRAATLPTDNLLADLRRSAGAVGIDLLAQTADVFNKCRRILLFERPSSLVTPEVGAEILRHAGCAPEELARRFPADRPDDSLRAATAALDRVPLAALETVADALEPTPGTAELIHALKSMGYRTALLTRAFDLFAERVARALELDHWFGSPLPVDDDARAVDASQPPLPAPAACPEVVLARIIERERVSPEAVTTLRETPSAGGPAPGIRVRIDLRPLLDLHNKRVLSRDNLLGILVGLGQPRP